MGLGGSPSVSVGTGIKVCPEESTDVEIAKSFVCATMLVIVKVAVSNEVVLRETLLLVGVDEVVVVSGGITVTTELVVISVLE